MPHQSLIADIACVLGVPDSQVAGIRLEPCDAGGNNRVFAATVGARKVVAKWYFRHPSDGRDRLKAEYAFLSYAHEAGIRCVPQPIACDAGRGVGIYAHIEGRKLTAREIDADCVDQAADFFLRLNHAAARAHARELPDASEACFSIAAHFAMVDARIARLDGIPAVAGIDNEARTFVAVLRERWHRAKAAILRNSSIDPDQPLAERCISPSDFGFHNALATEHGIFFLDFEYAGWDDPAKMAGDFFSHPAVGVDDVHFERFLDAAMAYVSAPAALVERARLLFPVFQTKWCCIILNDFLPEFARRRRFADPNFDLAVRKREQLTKAVALLERIKS